MPFKPASPETGKIQVEQDKPLDVYRIQSINMLRDVSQGLVGFQITYTKGYMDDKTYVPVENVSAAVAPDIAAKALEGKPNFVKNTVATAWQLLQAAGELPDGTLS